MRCAMCREEIRFNPQVGWVHADGRPEAGEADTYHTATPDYEYDLADAVTELCAVMRELLSEVRERLGGAK